MVQTIEKPLKSHGVTVNISGIFIANIIIYGRKCTIAWYVDNNKVSHVEK